MESIITKYQGLIAQLQQGNRSQLQLSQEEWNYLLAQLEKGRKSKTTLEVTILRPILTLLAHFRPGPAQRYQLQLLSDQPLLDLFRETLSEHERILILQIFNNHLWPKYLQNSKNLPQDHLQMLAQVLSSESFALKSFCVNLLLNMGSSVRPLALQLQTDFSYKKNLYFFLHPSKQKRLWNKQFVSWIQRWN
jgi:hypothetical protein